MIQRNVAAAPVLTKIITSIFGLPSSPAKRRTAINYRTSLIKKCVLFLESHKLYLCGFVEKRDQNKVVCNKSGESLVSD